MTLLNQIIIIIKTFSKWTQINPDHNNEQITLTWITLGHFKSIWIFSNVWPRNTWDKKTKTVPIWSNCEADWFHLTNTFVSILIWLFLNWQKKLDRILNLNNKTRHLLKRSILFSCKCLFLIMSWRTKWIGRNQRKSRK